MVVFKVLLAAGLLGAAGAAPAADKPGEAAAVPQNRCFCVQYTGGLAPYYIGKPTPPAPECAEMRYDGKAPQENGLLSCEELQKCLKGQEGYAEKKKILEDKASQAKSRLAACCASGGEEKNAKPCGSKCAGDWEGILKVLAAETVKLDAAALKARELCFSKAKKIKS